MKVASTKLTNPVWEALQDKCNVQGLTIAEHLRNLIQNDLDMENASLSEEESVSASDEPSNQVTSSLVRLFGKKVSSDNENQSEPRADELCSRLNTPDEPALPYPCDWWKCVMVHLSGYTLEPRNATLGFVHNDDF